MPFHLSEKLLLGFLLAMNLLSFCLMGLDKRRAVKGQWRISERALLLFGFFGGSLGGLLGMFLFRHKTKHRKFTVLMPLFLVFHMALLCLRNIMSPFALKPAAVPGTPLNRLSTLFTGPACLLDKS